MRLSGGVDARAAARGRSRDSRSCRTTSTSPSRTSARAAEASERAPLPMVAGGLGARSVRSGDTRGKGRRRGGRDDAPRRSRAPRGRRSSGRARSRVRSRLAGAFATPTASDEACGRNARDDEKTEGGMARETRVLQKHHYSRLFRVNAQNSIQLHVSAVFNFRAPKNQHPRGGWVRNSSASPWRVVI